MFCKECGKEYSEQAAFCPGCGSPTPNGQQEKKAVWSSGRLIISVISMVLCLLILFQSCAAGISNALQDNGATSGTSGMMLAFCMLLAGIIGAVTRKSKSQIVTMLPGAFYWFGSLMTFGTGSTYGDLPIWGGVSFFFGAVFVAAGLKMKKH